MHLEVSCRHQDTHVHPYIYTCTHVSKHTAATAMKEHPGRHLSGWVLGASLNICSRDEHAQAPGDRNVSPRFLPHVATQETRVSRCWELKSGDTCVQMQGPMAWSLLTWEQSPLWLREGLRAWPEGRRVRLSCRSEDAAEPGRRSFLSQKDQLPPSAAFQGTVYAAGGAPRLAPRSQTRPLTAAGCFSISHNSHYPQFA